MSEVKDGSYDIVWYRTAWHHLPCPVLGFTEMLRVAQLRSSEY